MRKLSQLAFLLGASVALAPAASISLLFSDTTPEAGSDFTLTVSVTGLGTDTLVTFGMNPYISDTSKVTFEGYTVGPLFFDDFIFFGGNPTITGDTFPPADSSLEPIVLATLTFHAVSLGPVTVGVSSDLGDPNQGLGLNGPGPEFLPFSADLSASQQISVVPEPATVSLLVTALAGLVWKSRRKRSSC